MQKFNVPDMSCGHCKAAIQKAISAADTTAKLSFDMDARVVEITSALSSSEVSDLLKAEGYENSVAA